MAQAHTEQVLERRPLPIHYTSINKPSAYQEGNIHDKDQLAFPPQQPPCIAYTREQLPVLLTDHVQQYALATECDQMKPTDPSNRRYHFRHLDQDDFQKVAKACCLSHGQTSPSGPTIVMHLYFIAMDDIIPRCRLKMSLSAADAKALAAAIPQRKTLCRVLPLVGSKTTKPEQQNSISPSKK